MDVCMHLQKCARGWGETQVLQAFAEPQYSALSPSKLQPNVENYSP